MTQVSLPSRLRGLKVTEEDKQTKFLFFFPNERQYLSIGVDSLHWPAKVSLTEKVYLSVGETLNLRFEGKFYPALLLAKGRLDEIKTKERRLGIHIESEENISSSNLSFLDRSRQRGGSEELHEPFTQTDAVPENGHRHEESLWASNSYPANVANEQNRKNPFNRSSSRTLPDAFETGDLDCLNIDIPAIDLDVEQTLPNIEVSTGTPTDTVGDVAAQTLAVLKEIKDSLDQNRRESRRLRQTIDKMMPSIARTPPNDSPSLCIRTPKNATESVASVTTPIFCKGVNLLEVEGSDPAKFGVNCAKKIFTRIDLKNKMCSPQRSSTPREPLPQSELSCLKKACEQLFPGRWVEARESINQLGRDYKRKDLKRRANLIETAENDENLEQACD